MLATRASGVAVVAIFVVNAAGCGIALAGERNLVTTHIDAEQRVELHGQRPRWATAEHDLGPVAKDLRLGHLTLLLKHSAQQQRDFNALLVAQKDPASPSYQHWLTPAEIGTRFGASQHDIDAIATWLADQGIQVKEVSANRLRIEFSATANTVGTAFNTQLRYFSTRAGKRIATAGATQVPAALANAIHAVVGLDSMRWYPTHLPPRIVDSNRLATAPTPEGTQCDDSGCTHIVFPADFAKIYNLEEPNAQGLDGSGQTIAIVARSRVYDADISNFQTKAALPARQPVTVIPPDGIDPGPAATSCGGTGEPDCDAPFDQVSDQFEATLDVQRAQSAAPGASIRLIASAGDNNTEGAQTALEYAIDGDPVHAKIISVSFGSCEADNSSGAAAYLDDLFAQAAMQGISVFIASGDSGATDCASHLDPPNGDQRLSINLLCASSHITCVGGTQFNDDPSDQYWSRNNGTGFLSALGYIPEGAWNEPGDSSSYQLAASGGGVSQYLPTPDWQTGVGIPPEREGRYVPDVSLGASAGTGYFMCMAAGNGPCVSSNGQFNFLVGAGTSASAPSMAGIAALLNQKVGTAQGNLNPRLYALAGNPDNGVFHDITVDSSGEHPCSVDIPSSCNNSTPGPDSLHGGATGYLVGPLHDRVTGLGSVDVGRLLANWSNSLAAGVSMNQRGLLGSWANPATDSQGFLIDIEPDFYAPGAGLVFGGWFTYDFDFGSGGQRWYTIQGQANASGAAVMPIYATVGGAFDTSQPSTIKPIGTAILSFQDCGHGRLDYDIDFGDTSSAVQGTIPLTRLLSNIDCNAAGTTENSASTNAVPDSTSPESGQSPTASANPLAGAWADPGNSGQGLVIDMDPVQHVLFAAWYTFAVGALAGSDFSSLPDQRWYTLQATLQPDSIHVQSVGIYNASGGVFDRSANTVTQQVGNADLTFHSCSTATLNYHFTSGENAGHSGTLDLHRVTPTPPGCHL